MTEKTMAQFIADQEAKKRSRTIKDIIPDNYCECTGEPSFHIEFPTNKGTTKMVAQSLRICLSHPNWNCNFSAYSNPEAYQKCTWRTVQNENAEAVV